MNQADTAWMLISTALVLLMTPALAFFYGGLVRSKNALNTMMMSFISLGFVGVLWAVVGYSLAFSTGNDWLGDLSNAMLNGVGLEAKGTIPAALFMSYQGTFAIITAALISGSIVERMRFSAYTAFITLWVLAVYAPIAHWVWGGGWLAQLGALDFAGGTVVHVNAAAAAVVAAVVLGKRSDYGSSSLLPHNVPFVLLGAGLLWFGWFGFNAGSALAANELAVNAFVVTNTAAAMAALTWMTVSWAHHGRPSVLGAAAGAVAGLVAITPACGWVGTMGSIAIGAIAALICLWAVSALKKMLGYDDSLDVFGVHCIGGICGALLTGIFNSPALGGTDVYDYVANAYPDPSKYSIADHFISQAWGVGVTILWCGIVSLVAYKLVDLTIGLRVTEEQEREGLDTVSHGERAYNG
jgi:Amt family ammonium transporter